MTFFTRTSISSPPLGEEPLDEPGLLVGLDRGVGEAAVEKVERLGILLAHGRAHAAVVHRDELHEEVLQLRRLRRVGQAVVADGGRVAHVVDPNDEGLEVAERALRVHVQHDERHDDGRQARHRDLQIRVHHQRRAVLLDVPASGLAVFVAGGRQVIVGVVIGGYPKRRGKADWPADPENSECVSDGTFSKP